MATERARFTIHLSVEPSLKNAFRVALLAAVHAAADMQYAKHMEVATIDNIYKKVTLAFLSYTAIAFAIAAADPGQSWLSKLIYCALIVWPLSYWIFNTITVLVVPLSEAGWSKYAPDKAAAIDTTWGLFSTLTLTTIDHYALLPLLQVPQTKVPPVP